MFSPKKMTERFKNDRDTSQDLPGPVDLHVHKRDTKGAVVNEDLYRLVIENGQYFYEVPRGSGKFYSANGHYVKDMGDEGENMGKGFDSGAPMSHPAKTPDSSKLGDVKDDGQPTKVGDDHAEPKRAQQEYQEQAGKAQNVVKQDVPQPYGTASSPKK